MIGPELPSPAEVGLIGLLEVFNFYCRAPEGREPEYPGLSAGVTWLDVVLS